MVAYSFRKQFAPHIQDGTKTGTIRKDRKRHAKAGEPIQLYQGMRTKYCRKIIPDPICLGVYPVRLEFNLKRMTAITIGEARWMLHRHGFDLFAQKDGFKDMEEMHAFWVKENGIETFNGCWIRWANWNDDGIAGYLQ